MFARPFNIHTAPTANGRRTVQWSTEVQTARSNLAALSRGPQLLETRPSRMRMRDVIPAAEPKAKCLDALDDESEPEVVGNSPDPGAPSPAQEPPGPTPSAPTPPPSASPSAPAPAPAPTPAAPGTTKTAGVDSFTVTWKENPATTPTSPRLRIDFSATFKDDATHDPALAEFRQNEGHLLLITAGPHSGTKKGRSFRDDNYSRADDKVNAKTSKYFACADNPGMPSISADDVIDYTVTAEQMIIDTSTNNVVQKKGPHTGTIKGKHPRVCGGVPVTL